MLKQITNACHLYILLWLLGYVQNIYLNSSLLSMVFYIPFTLMTIYYVAQVAVRYRTRGVMKMMLLFFLFLCIYGVDLLLFEGAAGQDPKSFLMMLLSSLGPIFPFYVFAKHGLMTEQKMKYCFIVFLIVAIMEYFAYQQKALMLLALNSSYDEITNNTTYYFVALLPFVFLFNKKPVAQYLLIACILGFVVSGMKRGAILISALFFIWFVFRNMKSASPKKRIWVIGLLILFVFIGFYFIENLYQTSDYFQRRIEDTTSGQSSGRGTLYSTYWNHYLDNNNLLQLIFGEGAYYTENIMQLKAHNDWLELLIDCGLCGVLLYFIYWCYFFKLWKRYKGNQLYYSIIGACLLFTLVRTFFSMSFSDMPFSMCMLLGNIFALSNHNYTYSKNRIVVV